MKSDQSSKGSVRGQAPGCDESHPMASAMIFIPLALGSMMIIAAVMAWVHGALSGQQALVIALLGAAIESAAAIKLSRDMADARREQLRSEARHDAARRNERS